MQPTKQHVALIGLSGAGKSTAGRLLARALDVPFVDTDREIEQTAGMPIHRIFTELGEPGFRRLEADRVRKALEGPRSVVSLGGGAILDGASRQLIWARAVVVWLQAEPETLVRRLSLDRGPEIRPLLQADDQAARLGQLLAERQAYYAGAHVQIDTTNQSTEEIVSQVVAAVAPHRHPG